MDWRVPVIGVVVSMAATAALAQEREWNFGTNDTEAYLVFGVPESEDVGLSFWCPQAGGEVRIFVGDANEKLAPDIDTKIEFIIGDKTYPVAAHTMPNELDGTTSAEGTISAKDPLFSALNGIDRFLISVAGEQQTFPTPGTDLADLIAACSKTMP
jgi:hypothetical protein